MMLLLQPTDIKLVLIAIWAIWLTLVTLMNAAEALIALGVLPKDFKFASSNWTLMLNVTAIYRTPRAVVALMFAGVLVWEALATVVLWAALISRDATAANTGFGLLIALWGGFLIMSQLFKSFVVAPAIPEAHRSIFGICVATLIALQVL